MAFWGAAIIEVDDYTKLDCTMNGTFGVEWTREQAF